MKKIYVVLFHIVYWLSGGVTIFMSMASYHGMPAHEYYFLFAFTLVSFFTRLSSFYVFYFYFFPEFLAKQKIKLFTIYGLLAFVLITTTYLVLLYCIVHVLDNKPSTHSSLAPFIYGTFISVVSSAIAGCLGRGIISWYGDIKYKKELENRNLHTELALLKAQINPHFLFNTLNNIDILMEKDAPTASIYLKKLSDILRFTLYETSAETIPLTSELAYIKEYIELQKIRTANPDFVKFEVSGHTEGLHVAPMIFIPFIENAFKHSTNKKVDTAIDISFSIENDNIVFNCVNVFDHKNALQQPNSGLGLELMKNRLNLLYKDNHQLDVEQTDNRYAVHLVIKADDH